MVWSVPDVATLSIDQGVGDVSAKSSVGVKPASSTTYSLVAKNAFGERRSSVTVSVGAVSSGLGTWEEIADGTLAGDVLGDTGFRSIFPEALKDGRVLLSVTNRSTPLFGARYVFNPSDKSIKRISDATSFVNQSGTRFFDLNVAVSGNLVLATGPRQGGVEGETGLYFENIDTGAKTFN